MKFTTVFQTAVVYHSDRQAVFPVRFRRAGELATADTRSQSTCLRVLFRYFDDAVSATLCE